MSKIAIRIPETLKFTDLNLAFDQSGMISFDWQAIEQICAYNHLPIDVFKQGPEDNAVSLIVVWYGHHRQAGGALDPVMEEYIAEVRAEDASGLIVDSITKTDQ
jgi:hypothetical protein